MSGLPGSLPSGSPYRYAVYLVPTGPWARLGARWLGRDAASELPAADRHRVAVTGRNEGAADGTSDSADVEDVADVVDTGRDPRIDAWTEAPRHYGLHATLKPPFRLHTGASASISTAEASQALDAALRELAQAHAPFEVALRLRALRGFLAWGLAHASAPLQRLADDCVSKLDRFRAPAPPEEIARRRKSGLSAEQDAHLLRWGYPYVFDTFVFHITLTGKLDDAAMAEAQRALARMAGVDGKHDHSAARAAEEAKDRVDSRAGDRLGDDDREALRDGAMMPVEDIGLFVQMAPDQPFVLARRYRFDGTVRDETGAPLAGMVES